MSKESSPNPTVTFKSLGLPEPLLLALNDVGYETPSPIQSETIPYLLEGLDLLGHAPTGTGKTAAFALPLLTRLNLKEQQVQVLVLTPTRELAIQVAEAFKRYANHLEGFHVLPIYGGQEYTGQIRALKRGLHVVVGTPGRVMDHMRKGTLKLDKLQALVLDEADEMLRMGFIDDVEWILEQTPDSRQIALFSATMPTQIKRIAERYLNKPKNIAIKARTATAESINQRYWLVNNLHKLDALTRILEVEEFDAILMFVRTKIATVELAERLEARGYAAEALNGDMPQKNREQMIERLKKGSIDILVATDVAARGLDVERISHVVNYDIPYDAEAYIHRIGRTGRAGRTGEAILFVTSREQRMLAVIERATRQKITAMVLPTTDMVNSKRIAKFKQSITDVLALGELDFMQGILEQYQHEHEVTAIEIAAALAKLSIGSSSLLLEKEKSPQREQPRTGKGESRGSSARSNDSRGNDSRGKTPRTNDSRTNDSREIDGRRNDSKSKEFVKKESTRNDSRLDTEQAPRDSAVRTLGRNDTKQKREGKGAPREGMEQYRIEVGRDHEVQPGNIVGAIANEAGLDAENIGHIDIKDTYSLIELPSGMPKDIFKDLKKVWVSGQQLQIKRLDATSESPRAAAPRTVRPKISFSQGEVKQKLKPREKKAVEKKRAKKKLKPPKPATTG